MKNKHHGFQGAVYRFPTFMSPLTLLTTPGSYFQHYSMLIKHIVTSYMITNFCNIMKNEIKLLLIKDLVYACYFTYIIIKNSNNPEMF
jgi:hypothetical protein